MYTYENNFRNSVVETQVNSLHGLLINFIPNNNSQLYPQKSYLIVCVNIFIYLHSIKNGNRVKGLRRRRKEYYQNRITLMKKWRTSFHLYIFKTKNNYIIHFLCLLFCNMRTKNCIIYHFKLFAFDNIQIEEYVSRRISKLLFFIFFSRINIYTRRVCIAILFGLHFWIVINCIQLGALIFPDMSVDINPVVIFWMK